MHIHMFLMTSRIRFVTWLTVIQIKDTLNQYSYLFGI